MIEKRLVVRPDWIDGNGHMHDARYVDAFHAGAEEMFDRAGLGLDYRKTGFALFQLGMNLDYLRELFEGDPLRVSVKLLDFNHKLIHMYLELYHEGTGLLCATNERLLIHVNLSTRKSAPIPADNAGRLYEVRRECSVLPLPANLGRSLSIRR